MTARWISSCKFRTQMAFKILQNNSNENVGKNWNINKTLGRVMSKNDKQFVISILIYSFINSGLSRWPRHDCKSQGIILKRNGQAMEIIRWGGNSFLSSFQDSTITAGGCVRHAMVHRCQFTSLGMAPLKFCLLRTFPFVPPFCWFL